MLALTDSSVGVGSVCDQVAGIRRCVVWWRNPCQIAGFVAHCAACRALESGWGIFSGQSVPEDGCIREQIGAAWACLRRCCGGINWVSMALAETLAGLEPGRTS